MTEPAEQTASAPEVSDSFPAPTAVQDRIQSLDVLRGFALLGILLLNIVGMGMLSTAYFHPFASTAGEALSTLDLRVWQTNELLFEGSMRAMFSMLFGAGVVLFTSNKSGRLHYRRTFWLFVFGLIDGFILLWSGDILVVYAIAGAILFLARDASAKRLLIGAAVLMLVLFGIRLSSTVGLGMLQATHEQVVALEARGETVTDEQREMSEGWLDFAGDTFLTDAQIDDELSARRGSYLSALAWNAPEFFGVLVFVLPAFMLWDALLMMLLGMALYKLGILQGRASQRLYLTLALAGLATGLLFNVYEMRSIVASNYDALTGFSFLQPTYDFGRLGLGLGYMGLVLWWCNSGLMQGLKSRLAAVGRMALTNYLMHSLIALVLFTGVGFALVGTLERWQLYPIVLGIWLFQLWFSPWWLARRSQGPLEQLWRRLTYGGNT